jgi:hypothetical protein
MNTETKWKEKRSFDIGIVEYRLLGRYYTADIGE